jgi:hypothetical protein
MLSSPETSVDCFEIWLWARPDHKIHVGECGSFRSEGDAERVAGYVRMWLQTRVWMAELTAAMPDRDDQLSLFALPEVLRAWGIDPALTVVEPTRPDDEDTRYCGGPDDTVAWANPAVRRDAGSVAKGPHDVVNVRAERR